MKCSSCKVGDLQASKLEGLFASHTCNHCGGDLILLGDFMQWQKLNPGTDLHSHASIDVVTPETSKAMICPLSGTIMTKYRITADTEHRLDLSPTINAVWLDKGEWDLLKQKGLATKLNNIFTDHWQREVHEDEASEILNDLHVKMFGEHFDDIKRFKKMLEKMKNSREVIAYLLADEPHSISS
jgi:Zn-finger nucleic acid-binding protein